MPKIQRITFNASNITFQLSFSSNSTDTLTHNTSSSEIQDALNELLTVQEIGAVVVTTVSLDADLVINIIFVSHAASLPDVVVVTGSVYQSFIVQMNAAAMPHFTLGFDLRVTESLTPETSSEDLALSVTELFSTQCSRINLANPFFADTFEVALPRPTAPRDGSVQSLCGRYSMKNPGVIFKAGTSLDEVKQEVLGEFTAGTNPSRKQFRYVSLFEINVLNYKKKYYSSISY